MFAFRLVIFGHFELRKMVVRFRTILCWIEFFQFVSAAAACFSWCCFLHSSLLNARQCERLMCGQTDMHVCMLSGVHMTGIATSVGNNDARFKVSNFSIDNDSVSGISFFL